MKKIQIYNFERNYFFLTVQKYNNKNNVWDPHFFLVTTTGYIACRCKHGQSTAVKLKWKMFKNYCSPDHTPILCFFTEHWYCYGTPIISHTTRPNVRPRNLGVASWPPLYVVLSPDPACPLLICDGEWYNISGGGVVSLTNHSLHIFILWPPMYLLVKSWGELSYCMQWRGGSPVLRRPLLLWASTPMVQYSDTTPGDTFLYWGWRNGPSEYWA